MELVVYKASAGSGKTFTLAVEYIKLLIENPKAYRQILAVTFTNKATAEMKERILSQLYGIRTADPGSEPYLNRIAEQTGKNTDEIRKAAGVALDCMLHDYSRFRVETIDSFFQSVMRNLARELELSPNLNVELNNEEVLSDAVDQMIEKLGPTSPVLAWLLDYIYERIAEDKRWNVAGEVKAFGRNIFDEGYIERGEGLRNKLKSDPNLIRSYRNELNELEEEALEQMKGFAEQFGGILEEYGLTADSMKGGSKGIGSYFRKLAHGILSDDIRNKTVEKCLEDPTAWAAKSSGDYALILRLAEDTLMSLLEDAENFRKKNNVIVNSCRLSAQHLNKVRLLTNIDEEVRLLNREHNRFLLSDTNALLHRLIGDGDSSFVFEKIGTNIQNVMIDEFQDTSRMQWDNFRLLLQEGLAQGADSLIVGDVKQSIYRWRNGDWKILNSLDNHLGSFPIRVETLKVNRRSETNIIRFNNAVFKAVVENLNSRYKEELGRECPELLNAYADVSQDTPKEYDAGYVRLNFLEPDEEHTYQEATLQAMGEEVEHLLAQGVKLNDIAILVRKNKNIPAIADYFDRTLHYKIVSDEAFRLDASIAVNMLINAVRLLSDPDNKIAGAALAMDYVHLVRKRNDELDELMTGWKSRLPEAFYNRLDELRLMPLYELLEELFRLFDLQMLEEQDAYLFAFFDAVTDYLQNNSSDPDAFLAFWDETLSSKNIPSGEVEGIRIFSIHKSKGLEFHTVLIPFCDWKMENETNNQLVWCVPEVPPFDQLDIVPVNYSNKMAQSVYMADYEKEKLQLWVDNLNLLYVAFTRAGKNLITWSRMGQKNTMSDLLYTVLPEISKTCTDMVWKEDSIFEFGRICPSEEKQQRRVTNKLLIKPDKCAVHMCSFSHEVEFRQSNRSADFIAGTDEETSPYRFIDRGKLLHTLFAGISTLADIDRAVDRLVFEGVIGSVEREAEIRAFVHQAFRQPEVQEWYREECELFNECSIVYRKDGKVETRRPDRVMKRNGLMIVVDFKFGKASRKYNRQVAEYMDLLKQMGYREVKGYLWYVYESRIEQVLP